MKLTNEKAKLIRTVLGEADFANYMRVVAEDEGNIERADELFDAKLTAYAKERIAAERAAFVAEWTPEVFAVRRAAWNAAIGTPAQREKVVGFSFDAILRAKKMYS